MKGIINGIQGLINMFANLWDMIKLVWQFLSNIISSIMNLFELLMTTINNTNILILTLPPWLIATTTATLSICVLYLIVGRQGGK